MDVALPGSGPLKFSEMGEVVRGQTPGTQQKLSEIFVDAEANKIWSPGDKVVPHNSSELYRYPKISDTFDWDPDLWACELREPLIPPIAFATSSGVITNGSAQIDGSTSYDPDGTIDIYAWRQISVSTTTVITDPTAAVTTVTGLNSEGLFIYELTVTDNDGLTDTDTTIIVGNICISAATPVVDDSGITVTIYWKIVTTSGAFVNRDLVINAVINPGNDIVGFGIPAGSNSSNATKVYDRVDGTDITYTLTLQNGNNYTLCNTTTGDAVVRAPKIGTMHVNAAIDSGSVAGDGFEYLKFNLNSGLINGFSVDSVEYEGHFSNDCSDDVFEFDNNTFFRMVIYSSSQSGVKYDDFDYKDTDQDNWIGINTVKITKVIIRDSINFFSTTVTISGTEVGLSNGDRLTVTFGCEEFDVK